MTPIGAATPMRIWAHGVVVSHPLSMREALGSIPSVSTLQIRPSFACPPQHTMLWRLQGTFLSGTWYVVPATPRASNARHFEHKLKNQIMVLPAHACDKERAPRATQLACGGK